jgi:hypothetical protein
VYGEELILVYGLIGRSLSAVIFLSRDSFSGFLDDDLLGENFLIGYVFG